MFPDEHDRASRLAFALRAAGMDMRVESQGTLAVLTSTASMVCGLTNDERRVLLQLSRAEGYSHAALEIIPR